MLGWFEQPGLPAETPVPHMWNTGGLRFTLGSISVQASLHTHPRRSTDGYIANERQIG